MIFFSCTSKKNDVRSIELMAYKYEMENSKRVVNSFLYSSLDTIGNSKILRKIDSVNVVGYNFQIDQKIMHQILNLVRDKQEKYFSKKSDTIQLGCYLGPVIRFKIFYSNGKELSFNYLDENYDEKSKYHLFKLLYEELLYNVKTDVYKKPELDLIKLREKEFKIYAYHKDTLDLPLPPPPPPAPKIDEVKFVK